MNIQLLGISGSLRRQSRNSGLLRPARARLPANVQMDIADLTAIPFYNADLQAKPDSVVKVLEQIKAADAYVFACPEYNYSIAPALKNILDWASREPGNGLLADKAAAIMGLTNRPDICTQPFYLHPLRTTAAMRWRNTGSKERLKAAMGVAFAKY